MRQPKNKREYGSAAPYNTLTAPAKKGLGLRRPYGFAGGFTLVELIVSLAIAAILAVCIVAIMVPVYNSYRTMQRKSEAQMIAQSMLDRIEDTVSVSVNFKVADVNGASTLTTDDHTITTSADGYLNIDNSRSFDDDYYNGMTSSVIFTSEGIFRAGVAINIYDGAELIYTLNGSAYSIRGLISDSTKNSPDGMLQLVNDAIAAYTGQTYSLHNDVFWQVYNNDYASSFPGFDVTSVISATKLNSLYTSAAASYPAWNGIVKRYKSLLSDSFIIAPYITSGTNVPFIYVTNAPTRFSSGNTHAPVYLLYFNGIWYIPMLTDTEAPYACPSFNGLSAAAIQSTLNNTSQWLPVGSL